MKQFIFIISIFLLFLDKALAQLQASPAELKCVSVNDVSGDITISWVPPPDPLNQFFSYEIFQSNSYTGPYLLINTITNIAVNSYTHVGAGGNTQSRYYFIRTRWGPGGVTASALSDTIQSIFLTLTGIGGGVAKLNYNNIAIPPVPTSYPMFDVYRNTSATMPFNLIDQTSQIKYNDTVSRLCNGINYYYYIELKDSSGCSSISNIANGSFVDNTPPAPPTLDSASVLSNGQVILGWTTSASNDCMGYIIYEVINNINVPIDTVWGCQNSSYTYTNTNANNNSLEFVVATIDSCNNVSVLSSSQETMFLQHAYNTCEHSINLQWNKPTIQGGVDKYYIYLSTNGGSYVLIDSTIFTQYSYNQLNYNNNYCIYIRTKSKTGITVSSNIYCFTAYGPSVPSFIYTRYASIKDTNAVDLAFYIDTSITSTAIELERSIDNINYQTITVIPTTTNNSSYFYTDTKNINTLINSYYYRAYILDSCNNRRNVMSNISKTMLLKVNKDKKNVFTANLNWSDYQGWSTGVSDYYVYRIIDGVIENTPRAILPPTIKTYSDDYSDLYYTYGKIGYIIIASENIGNPYGFSEAAYSNIGYIFDEGNVFTPNAFAPNGINKIWKPVFQFPNNEDYHLWIYNKWGQVVFETTDINEGWTGDSYPQDVYVYFIRYKNSKGEYLELKGSINLLR